MKFCFFPFLPGEEEWRLGWFPKKPDDFTAQLDPNNIDNDIVGDTMIRTNRIKTMGISEPNCDDAEVG